MAENRFLQLPYKFDPAAMQQDLQHCMALQWPTHFNQKDYIGEWNSISLRSASGRPQDISSFAGSVFKDTDLLQQTPYFSYILHQFNCPLEAVRLLRLGKDAMIKPHRDLDTGYKDGNVRIHIPVITHPEVIFMLDDVRLEMKAGECWYADFTYLHSVVNNSPVDRVHLVIDALRNDWTDELFSQQGFPLPSSQAVMDKNTLQLMIAELENHPTPNQALIAQLKASFSN
ncbi:aspartyl/asparaginyl beta-hydroxylase domain-containing protein [Chitinophaga sp. Hz27]|uniref:aspartyl/asparaginyl beta-hydroxylase domain-containing protein n=1 Tax=Chitinophaga sp. Hz27 TaxID=3347169 RepID=UPI0035DA2B0F